MQRVYILLILALTLWGCDGSYKLAGKVYEEKASIRVPIDSVLIKVYVGRDWFRGQTYSDPAGSFNKKDFSTPEKSTYYFIFEKRGFKTDTVIKEGKKGKSVFEIEHRMFRK